jgi:L-iditol 2-dehydrogenase
VAIRHGANLNAARRKFRRPERRVIAARPQPALSDVVEDELMKVTAGRGVDVVVEMAGTDDAIATAVACTRPGARVALGGIPSGPQSSFPAAAARRKGLTFAMVRRMHDTYAQAVELATTASTSTTW